MRLETNRKQPAQLLRDGGGKAVQEYTLAKRNPQCKWFTCRCLEISQSLIPLSTVASWLDIKKEAKLWERFGWFTKDLLNANSLLLISDQFPGPHNDGWYYWHALLEMFPFLAPPCNANSSGFLSSSSFPRTLPSSSSQYANLLHFILSSIALLTLCYSFKCLFQLKEINFYQNRYLHSHSPELQICILTTCCAFPSGHASKYHQFHMSQTHRLLPQTSSSLHSSCWWAKPDKTDHKVQSQMSWWSPSINFIHMFNLFGQSCHL